MIKSKTYNIVGNQIQAGELAYTTIYVVKKDGIQHDLYSGSSNRAYIYNKASGIIVFSTTGTKAFVIYKETSPIVEPVPGICTPVTITPGEHDVAVTGTEHIRTYSLSGTAPFVLNVTTKPSWAEVEIVSDSFVRMFGTPTAEATESLVFDVTNCSSGSDSINETFDVIAAATTLYVTNYVGGAVINSISGLSYALVSGSFPIGYSQGISATHPHFTGIIKVNVSDITFPGTLKLFINTVEIEAVPVNSDGLHEFIPQIILSTDLVQILLLP